MSIGQIRLGPNLPILQKTVLGWVVSGPYQHNQEKILYKQGSYLSTPDQKDITLCEELKRFWEIENGSDLINTEFKFKESELECEEHFKANVCRFDNGRYQVRLPFKSDSLKLGESYSQALNRFKSLERRFCKNSSFRQEYTAVVNEFLTLNHMEIAPNVDLSKPHFFLPHHCVVKPSSSTTKMRVVFDGSAKTTTGVSLNDTLLTGPVIQEDLFSIAVRFRFFAFVFTADISKMYRQIVLHPDDRCFHLILWRENESDKVKTFQLNTVTYGTASASYLATKTLQQLSLDEGKNFPNAARAVKMDFYVDDLLTGAATLEEALKLKSELIELLARGGFILRKWCSNDNRILEAVDEVDRESLFRIADSHAIKTLGTYWDPTSDKLLYDCPENHNNNSITKRIVLSEIAKLFDPLGLINPIIVLAKVFMQQLWQHGFDWDESLPMEYHSRWLRFREELENVGKFQFDRRAFYGSENIQLHAFADSSEYAYGTCLYIRSSKENGEISVNLLCSKSRVAPVKKVSIPRLELCAAVLMVHLTEKILNIFKGKFSKVFYWTDSTIVLSWISEASSNFETFVANRVAIIQNLTTVDQWNHVRSKMNPADIISRDADKWPVLAENCQHSIDESVLERKTQKIILFGSKVEPVWETIKFHNNYLKTLRVVAYLFRYKNNCLAVKREYLQPMYGEITPKELQTSLKCILRTIQQEQFSSEIELIRNKKPIPGRSHLASLRPFIDGDNLLRVGGRISNADLDYDARFPILIPKDHVFTKAIVTYYHNKYLHVGPQTLLSIIREKFWPIHGKIICKRVCRRCIRCFRAQPVPEIHIMGDLPRSRVQQCRPFLIVGVDLCGPFNIHFRRRGTSPIKGYVAVFVCFSTRAVHLEVVDDLSTVAFLAALKRFIGRRGYPSTIYSDNATNFIGARNELSSVYKMLLSPNVQNEVIRTCAADNITWKTIPPRSPHFGGLWEAAVKSAKFHMKRILQDASLTFQELNTIIIQIESVLNSRPITPISDNPSDLYALTPGHFIIGCPLTCLPEPDVLEVKSINSLSRYQLLQWYFQMFWKRWSTEYLQNLQLRTKWKQSQSQNNLRIGDVVLIVEENSPPLKWKLGKIIEVQPGKDDIVRKATVKTSTGIIERASMKLRRLPIEIEETASPQGGEDV
ncbi:uncharacterized protein LOC129946883 [Eupeodes corollae]|uniref:uncharacterized protein LOC129946883 n=1 Tax=Eupeodes corollae TaxID=290404 RepID=UPI002490C355|nr:uncharacterized protein LOC129946883 [Eupeodes corollae]